MVEDSGRSPVPGSGCHPSGAEPVPVSGKAGIPNAVPHLEFRPDDKGEFDELCAAFADGSVHMETMDSDSCYVGFYWDDGRYCQLWFGVKGKKLWYNHEHGTSEPPRYTAQGVDTMPHLPDYGANAAIAMETRRAETGNTDSVAKP